MALYFGPDQGPNTGASARERCFSQGRINCAAALARRTMSDHVRDKKQERGFEARSCGSGSKKGISWGPIGEQADVAQPEEDEWRPR